MYDNAQGGEESLPVAIIDEFCRFDRSMCEESAKLTLALNFEVDTFFFCIVFHSIYHEGEALLGAQPNSSFEKLQEFVSSNSDFISRNVYISNDINSWFDRLIIHTHADATTMINQTLMKPNTKTG